MRIITGIHARRNIKTLEGIDTRPTSEKLRGAIFNVLGQFFDEGRVLDLFSGSGAMALEAISRGCTQAICADISKEACTVIKQNVQAFGIEDQVTVLQKDYKRVLDIMKGQHFSFIFVDPPYDLHVIEDVVNKIDQHDLLDAEGKIVLEFSNRKYTVDALAFESFTTVFNRKYGVTQVMILEKNN